MERTVEIMQGTKVDVKNNEVVVSGPKGELKRAFFYPQTDISVKGNAVIVASTAEKKQNGAILGTWASHIKNMMLGVTNGYSAKMKVVHRHFPIAVKLQGKDLEVRNIRGQKNPIKIRIDDNVEVKVAAEDITVTGLDKEAVGNTVSRIENMSKVGSRTDRRIFYDGIYKVDE